jgi:hypothetical protein
MPKDAKDYYNPFLKFNIIVDVEVQILTFIKWSTFQICQVSIAKCDKKIKR